MPHIFLCCDQTNPKCCSKEEGLKVFEHLKKRLADLNLNKEVGVKRSKANCLQVCKNGPIAVVYPQGAWYEKVDIETIDKIIEKEILSYL